MASFLAAADAWVFGSTQFPAVKWEFDKDGSFVLTIADLSKENFEKVLGRQIPAGVRKLQGNWQATTTQLELSNLTTEKGEPVSPVAMDLRWVDGKLHVDIGEFRYARSNMGG